MQQGKLIIISAPSGAGKTTIVKHLMRAGLNLAFSVSATCRQPRHNEKHGVDYYFLTHSDFMKKAAGNEFIEWEEVYEGVNYGTLKSEVERITGEGKNVLFDVDVVGGVNIKKIYGNRALSIFIEAPSVEELQRRLISRNTDSPETIEKRIAKAEYEMKQAQLFDAIVVNDNLEKACNEAIKLVTNFTGL
ncbi:MAG: guanylate kinase [Cytophagaceae bacterium]|jgi:guanylate kinase|nr:guanylate kinase [Cytophagaceae bacterium]